MIEILKYYHFLASDRKQLIAITYLRGKVIKNSDWTIFYLDLVVILISVLVTPRGIHI